jgi:coenzyme F420-0:L-glutamate ligase / coenzyme F420-1:gamma-L-glutamate ligase
MSPPITILPVTGMGEIHHGDDLAALIWQALAAQGESLQAADVVVVTQKIVSKAEGRIVRLADVQPSDFARRFGEQWGKDPAYVEVVLRESRRIVKMDHGILITETHHGLICANSGVDESNVAGGGSVSLLPVDPDASAELIREGLQQRAAVTLAVLVSDTFGRPWRDGLVNVAIGVAGLHPLQSYIGHSDPYGYPLKVSEIAFADGAASAAELVMGKTDAVPVAIVRGARYQPGAGSAAQLIRPPDRDLFR